MKYYIIAGEASGDMHASNLIKEIKQIDTDAIFRCWGGDLIREQNAELVKHYRETSYMGFLEVVLHLPEILKNISYCKKDIIQFKPDGLILVDYPGFNMRIAEFGKSQNIPVFYYISPQVWAWKQSRVKKIRKYVDKMLTILPFEKDFYKTFNFEVDFVGHPLLDEIVKFNSKDLTDFKKINNLSALPIIALLPGSRKQEIANVLSAMLTIIPEFSNYQFVIAGMSSIPPDFYQKFIKFDNVKIIYNQTYNLLAHSHSAVVTSGTATLETALFEVPELVCYKGNYFSYLLARSFIKVKYISLVNLIMDKKIVSELIQNDLNTINLKTQLSRIVNDKDFRKSLIDDYRTLKQKLGGSGASKNAAGLIINTLHNKSQKAINSNSYL